MNSRWMDDSRRSDIWLLTRTDREALALDPCCSPLPRAAALVPHGENLQASVTVRLVARPSSSSSSSFADTSIGAGPSGVHLASASMSTPMPRRHASADPLMVAVSWRSFSVLSHLARALTPPQAGRSMIGFNIQMDPCRSMVFMVRDPWPQATRMRGTRPPARRVLSLSSSRLVSSGTGVPRGVRPDAEAGFGG